MVNEILWYHDSLVAWFSWKSCGLPSLSSVYVLVPFFCLYNLVNMSKIYIYVLPYVPFRLHVVVLNSSFIFALNFGWLYLSGVIIILMLNWFWCFWNKWHLSPNKRKIGNDDYFLHSLCFTLTDRIVGLFTIPVDNTSLSLWLSLANISFHQMLSAVGN